MKVKPAGTIETYRLQSNEVTLTFIRMLGSDSTHRALFQSTLCRTVVRSKLVRRESGLKFNDEPSIQGQVDPQVIPDLCAAAEDKLSLLTQFWKNSESVSGSTVP